MIQENKKAPNFTLPSSSGKDFELKKNLKNNLIIYFYPKDNTPGCTTESVEFAKQYKMLQKLKTEVVGISKDSMESHHKFIEKFKLPFPLLSDEHAKVLKLYGAWGEKSMYGKKFSCFSPMPSLAIHMTNVNSIYGISPFSNTLQLWNNS